MNKEEFKIYIDNINNHIIIFMLIDISEDKNLVWLKNVLNWLKLLLLFDNYLLFIFAILLLVQF